jgi:hypothetical protein
VTGLRAGRLCFAPAGTPVPTRTAGAAPSSPYTLPHDLHHSGCHCWLVRQCYSFSDRTIENRSRPENQVPVGCGEPAFRGGTASIEFFRERCGFASLTTSNSLKHLHVAIDRSHFVKHTLPQLTNSLILTHAELRKSCRISNQAWVPESLGHL